MEPTNNRCVVRTESNWPLVVGFRNDISERQKRWRRRRRIRSPPALNVRVRFSIPTHIRECVDAKCVATIGFSCVYCGVS